MLLMAQDEETGGAMTDEQVRDECLTLFLAGHETTANALTWTFYLLSQNPESERKFHAELDEVLSDKSFTPEDYPRLKYTEQILAESMRLFPPAWTSGQIGDRSARIFRFSNSAEIARSGESICDAPRRAFLGKRRRISTRKMGKTFNQRSGQ